MSIDDDLVRWKYLAAQAKQGRLTLDPQVAQAYAAACQTLIGGIKDVKDQISWANRIDSLGGFAWANELRDGLNGIVDGPDDSVQDTLDRYLHVAQLMSDTVNTSVRSLTGQDAGTAQGIGSAGRE